MISKVLPGSFRDPSGFLFVSRGQIYRQVNKSYKKNFDRLFSSGLYRKLIDEGSLISHDEVDSKYALSEEAYRVIKPKPIPFVSYPYEWSFSQLKDAALTTLKIQKKALSSGMSLKDASSFNIQFINGKPILIDTLSFEIYKKGKPWVSYRQFCEHFLTPLCLMSKKDIRLIKLLQIFINGVPLDLTSKLLPKKTFLSFSLLSHIHLHAGSQKYFAGRSVKAGKMGKKALFGLIESLEKTVSDLSWKAEGTAWGDYYQDLNYTKSSFQHKKVLVDKFLDKACPKNLVWDLGANVGLFSRLAAKRGVLTVSFDADPAAVEKNYLKLKRDKETRILPLFVDLTNPSPAVGWESEERESLIARGPADTVLALALIHHLAIANNLPFAKIASFFAKISAWLIVEFVPKSDSNVKLLLASREDVFADYSKENFENEFRRYFKIVAKEKIKKSLRTLYLMRRPIR